MMGAPPHFRQSETSGGGEIAHADEVREATTRLPERQREALTLDTSGRSYEEIAAAIGTNRDAVAQLVARARINLYDELRGTPLASVVPSPDCERALPLIAMREDGQIEASSGDADWLEAHLAGCDRCRAGEEQMRAAATAFLLAPPLATGTDFGEKRGGASGGAPETAAQEATVRTSGPAAPAGGRPRRRMTFAVISAVMLLLASVAIAVTGGDESTPVSPAADATSDRGAGQADRGGRPIDADNGKSAAAKPGSKKKAAPTGSTPAASDGSALAEEVTSPSFGAVGGDPASDGGRQGDTPATGQNGSGEAAVGPTRQTAASKPSSKAKATPAPAPAPPATAASPAPAPPPAPEEQPDGPGRSDEAPGKPADRPPR